MASHFLASQEQRTVVDLVIYIIFQNLNWGSFLPSALQTLYHWQVRWEIVLVPVNIVWHDKKAVILSIDRQRHVICWQRLTTTSNVQNSKFSSLACCHDNIWIRAEIMSTPANDFTSPAASTLLEGAQTPISITSNNEQEVPILSSDEELEWFTPPPLSAPQYVEQQTLDQSSPPP